MIATYLVLLLDLIYFLKSDYEMNWQKDLLCHRVILKLKFMILRIYHEINCSSHQYHYIIKDSAAINV